MRIYLRATEEALTVDIPEPTAGTGHRRGRGTILVVADDELVRSVLIEALESQGYETLTAGTGVEALELADLHAGPIDLVLSDVVLPGITSRQGSCGNSSRSQDPLHVRLHRRDRPRQGGDGSVPLLVMQQLYERIEDVLDGPHGG